MNQSIITSTFTLPNGLRVVHVPALSGGVTYCGLAVNAGSRDDAPDMLGLAHFVEHTLFKGTTHRRAWHIINRMEAVGGELNAYTTKETTAIYSRCLSGTRHRTHCRLGDELGVPRKPD